MNRLQRCNGLFFSLSDSVGFSRIQSDSVGFCNIRSDSVGFSSIFMFKNQRVLFIFEAPLNQTF